MIKIFNNNYFVYLSNDVLSLYASRAFATLRDCDDDVMTFGVNGFRNRCPGRDINNSHGSQSSNISDT